MKKINLYKYIFSLALCGIIQCANAQTSWNGNQTPINGNNNTGLGSGTLISVTPSSGGNNNTAVGYDAGTQITSGTGNTAAGALALTSTQTGTANTAIGYGTLSPSPTGSYPFQYCTAIGYTALSANTASYNTAAGTAALFYNTTGYPNDALGANAMVETTAGSYNVAVGFNAMATCASCRGYTAAGNSALFKANTGGANNTAFGYNAAYSMQNGPYNDAFGAGALYANMWDSYNVAAGAGALYNADAQQNVGIGYNALYNGHKCDSVTAFGLNALFNESYVNSSTALGANSLYNAASAMAGGYPCTAAGCNALYTFVGGTTMQGMTAMGYGSMQYATSLSATENSQFSTAMGTATLGNESICNYSTALGNFALFSENYVYDNSNTAIGAYAGSIQNEYLNCTFLGAHADGNAGIGHSLTTSTAIGYYALVTTSNTIVLGDVNTTLIDAQVTYVSDGRFKTNILENVKGLDFILKLRPVSYNFDARKFDAFRMQNMPDSYKTERTNSTDYNSIFAVHRNGLLAQEVETAAQNSGYDFNGVAVPQTPSDYYQISYELLVVPLVKSMQEQDSVIRQQQAPLDSVVSEVNALAAEVEEIKNCCTGENTNAEPTTLLLPALYNAVPNPASGSSTIYYYVPNTSNSAQLNLIDEQGVVLQNNNLPVAGNGSLAVNISNYSTGVYFYRLVVDGKVIDTKKLSVTDK